MALLTYLYDCYFFNSCSSPSLKFACKCEKISQCALLFHFITSTGYATKTAKYFFLRGHNGDNNFKNSQKIVVHVTN